MRLAYFTNTYPRATDTFIRREVTGLRKRGLHVNTYSVRQTGTDHDVDEEVIAEKNSTRFLLPINAFSLVAAIFSALVRNPLRFFSVLLLALTTSRPGFKGHMLQGVYFLEALVLARYLRVDAIDHIHNHLGDNSGTVTMLAARLLDIPFSISIHGPHIFFDGLHWALDKKTEYAKFICCIGHYCTSQMMLYTNRTYWHKFKIIRCGISLDQFEFKPPASKARKLVYCGRLSGEKGVPILFESLAGLNRRGYEFELTLLGDGEDRDYLQRLSVEYGIARSVNFTGFVNQEVIRSTLQNSDIFILPSFAEGIPVALMEAMAIGLPVITTYVGGIPELVINGKTGIVVYPSDTQGLLDAIVAYMDNPELCIDIALAARKKVEQEFEIEAQIDRLAALFQDQFSDTRS